MTTPLMREGGGVRSPCKGFSKLHCKLNAEKNCIGCGRTGWQIVNWKQLTREQKQQSIIEAAERLAGMNAEVSTTGQESQVT